MEKPKTKVLIVFYSTYGHVYTLAKEIAEGVKAAGAEVDIKRVAETLPKEVLEKMYALDAAKAWESVPIVKSEDLPNYDALILGFPTRFGLMAAQFKAFVDTLGQLWYGGSLVGKPVSFFTSTATQHGGVETTILSAMVPFLHLGCITVGVPPTFKGLGTVDEIVGITPYGTGTIAGGQG